MTLFLLACAVENDLEDKNEQPPVFDSGDTMVTDSDDSGSAPEEECNGLDDDGDGAVDEDFPDQDGNGRADCLDQDCPPMDVEDAGPTDIDEACLGTASADPWAVRIKWSFTSVTDCGWCEGTLAAPAVGHLDDDNGDGVIGAGDTPEVITTVNGSYGYVVALDGATGAVRWSYNDHDGFGSPALVDVDGDGVPEVLAGGYSRVLYALDATGALRWTAASASSASYVTPVAADLDGDGRVEVLDDANIINGEDGTLSGALDLPLNGFRTPTTADIDLNGTVEVLLDGGVFAPDGSVVWDAGLPSNQGTWPLVIQADSDAEAEVGFVSETLDLYDTDGTLLWSVAYPETNTQPGPPCVGDLDGDGAPEIVFSSYDTLFAYGVDGALHWSVAADDSSGMAGCATFDLDLDGAMEVLYADQSSFRILDGSTGAARFTDPNHVSSTGFEFPTVADVDGDGDAEILVGHQSSSLGTLTVYENDGTGWPAAPSRWAAHDDSGNNYTDTNGVAPGDTAWWDDGVFRGRPTEGAVSLPDLTVRFTDTCIADCTYGPVEVAAVVANEGGDTVPAGSMLSLYAVDGGGERLVRTETLPEIAAGTQLAGFLWSLDVADIGDGWALRVDEADTLRECAEDNNEDRWEDAVCP